MNIIWITLAILAHLFWALVNIGDKYILVNRIRNPYVYMVWLALLGVMTFFLLPFIDLVWPSGGTLWLLLVAAAVYFFGGFPYVKAMQMEEVTRINIWWNLIPIFSFFLAWVFLGEKLNAGQLVAFLLLIIGAMLASLHLERQKIRISKAVGLMLVACFSYAVYAVILRHITQIIPFSSAFIWINLLMVVFTPFIFFFKNFREDFYLTVREFNYSLFVIILGVSVLDLLGIFFNLWALSLGPAALVFAMEGWQALFVFAITLIVGLFGPKLLEEEMDKKNMILKISAMIFMITGVILVYLS